MCSHYQAEKRRKQIEKRFGIELPPDWEVPPGGFHMYPTQMAPFIRRPPERDSGDEAVPDVELVEGWFGLLPGFAKNIRYGVRTYNARTETVDQLASFKDAWAQGRHWIVPCEAIYEPDWRTGQAIPTRPMNLKLFRPLKMQSRTGCHLPMSNTCRSAPSITG